MCPLWHLLWVKGHHSVVRFLGVVWNKELAHLDLSITQASIRDAGIAKSVLGKKTWCMCWKLV